MEGMCYIIYIYIGELDTTTSIQCNKNTEFSPLSLSKTIVVVARGIKSEVASAFGCWLFILSRYKVTTEYNCFCILVIVERQKCSTLT